MNPQTPIEQVPDETLATYGWNLRETQDGHRRQVEVCEANLQAIRQEFVRRAELRQAEASKEETKKRSDHEALIEGIAAKLAGRSGHTVPQDAKVTGEEK